MLIIGISAYYHDSAVALIKDDKVIAAAQEERFSRKKHDASFPLEALKFCLDQAKANLSDVSYVTFYDKPLVKFERLLETYLSYAPFGIRSFVKAMPVWMKEKLFLKTTIKKELSKFSGINIKDLPPLLFAGHHQSHAASAFYPSPYERAAVLCLDGVGEWATTSVWRGSGEKLEILWEIDFPHSLGLLYSAFTFYTGFKVNSGEYKLMGLAPYGEAKYVDLIYKNLIDLKDDGTFRLNMDYFNFAVGLTMTNDKFHQLFEGPPRKPEGPITQKEMDLAASVQKVTEEVVLRLSNTIHKETGEKYLCLAGGVALNCVANGELLRKGPFQDLWIQPSAGDAGGALGAAYATYFHHLKNPRKASSELFNPYLGPEFSTEEIQKALVPFKAKYTLYNSAAEFNQTLAEKLDQGAVVGWFQGRMEFGPRALGTRSIIADPRNTEMQTTMNLKIKHRESFRPFAPSVLAEDAPKYFNIDRPSPYMLLVALVKENLRRPLTSEQEKLFGIEKLKIPRSEIPAVTHVDYSARLQTVHRETNPAFYDLISAFKNRSGCSVLVNTSFNVRGEPIVCTPEDAYRCFMRTKMDYLVLGHHILAKKDQPAWEDNKNWKEEFELD